MMTDDNPWHDIMMMMMMIRMVLRHCSQRQNMFSYLRCIYFNIVRKTVRVTCFAFLCISKSLNSMHAQFTFDVTIMSYLAVRIEWCYWLHNTHTWFLRGGFHCWRASMLERTIDKGHSVCLSVRPSIIATCRAFNSFCVIDSLTNWHTMTLSPWTDNKYSVTEILLSYKTLVVRMTGWKDTALAFNWACYSGD